MARSRGLSAELLSTCLAVFGSVGDHAALCSGGTFVPLRGLARAALGGARAVLWKAARGRTGGVGGCSVKKHRKEKSLFHSV